MRNFSYPYRRDKYLLGYQPQDNNLKKDMFNYSCEEDEVILSSAQKTEGAHSFLCWSLFWIYLYLFLKVFLPKSFFLS